MLSSMQIIIHLAVFLIIVSYKRTCRAENYRMSAGLLAFVIAGFNLACVGYLFLIQPSHAGFAEYLHIAASVLLLAVVMWFGGSTARMIDSVKRLLD